MRAGLVARIGDVIHRSDCETLPGGGIGDATTRLAALIQETIHGVPAETVAGIGISTAGPVDPVTGIYHNPPNLPGWHGHTMVPHLAQATGLPVNVIHDAHAAALAEARFGAARGAGDVVYVTVSTGIGGGMIANGAPVTGEHGFAGEIGHMIIDPDGPACAGGCRGCLEVMASGGGIAKQARQRIAAGATTSILELVNGDISQISGKHVHQAAESGDAVAIKIVDTALDALATGLANLLAAFDPGALVLGGAVMAGDEQVAGLSAHWDELLARVRGRSLLRFRDHVPIVKSALGDDVGLIGAAIHVFNQADTGDS